MQVCGAEQRPQIGKWLRAPLTRGSPRDSVATRLHATQIMDGFLEWYYSTPVTVHYVLRARKTSMQMPYDLLFLVPHAQIVGGGCPGVTLGVCFSPAPNLLQAGDILSFRDAFCTVVPTVVQ